MALAAMEQRKCFFCLSGSHVAQDLIGPSAAVIDNAAPNFTPLPETVVRLAVFEADVESHCNPNRAQGQERNADINAPALQPLITEGNQS